MPSFCPECGTAVPSDAGSCPGCGVASSIGTPQERDRSAAAERRQLSVLFCDLVASTEHAARLDPEDWRELIRAYQRACAGAIERYDGHVAQYLGDGVLAYFGYPRAHEDAAERAVRAGRAIVRGIRDLRSVPEMERFPPLAVRVGIHTGLAVVGEVGGGRRTETLALGTTTNIAARLQDIADADAVVISEATLRLVRGIFVTEGLGSQRLKGLSQPVVAHRVVQGGGVRSRLAAFGQRRTPFVGRESQVAELWERWGRVRRGEGQSVLLTGEAGVGKTRLVLALRERLGSAPHLWLECGAWPSARASAFHPMVELLERGLAFTSRDEVGDKLRKLENGLGLARLEVPTALPLLSDLLGLPVPDEPGMAGMDPETRRERTIAALSAWMVALARSRPVWFVVEDLHWADPSTLELLGRLVDRVPGRRVFLLLTARPDFVEPWPDPTRFTRIDLGNLAPRPARELIESVRGATPLEDSAIEQILERSDGIPLYLEELTRAAVEAKGPSAEIPATLQDSLMARLDRLGPAKELAQLASVVGREFSARLLAGASEAEPDVLRNELGRLVTSGLVVRRGDAGGGSYAFRHALIQEAAYGSLLRERRHRLHARVARSLEEHLPERAAMEPEILARHFDEAQMPLEAIHHYKRAGERETARSAGREALEHLRRALELVEALPRPQRQREELALLVALGPALNAAKGPGDEETGRVYLRARALCPDAAPELPHILSGLFTFHLNRGEMKAAYEVAQEQLELARRATDPGQRMRAHWSLGQTLCLQGTSPRAIEHLERALLLFQPTRDRLLSHDRSDQGVSLRSWLGWAAWLAGHPGRARAWAEEAVEQARSVGHPYSLVYALGFGAVLHYMVRERERAGQWGREVAELALAHGFPLYLAMGRLVALWASTPASMEAGRSEAIVERFRTALSSLTGRGNQFGRPMASAALAEILSESGRSSEALETLRSALEFAALTDIRYWDADLLRIQGEILLGDGSLAGRDSGERLLARALQTARAQGARSLELRAATSLARLLRERGESERARTLLAPICRSFPQELETPDLEAARSLLRESTSKAARRPPD
jgi:class 3 adenylate cyclase/tetratricopeptide (TPR) repeat protein